MQRVTGVHGAQARALRALKDKKERQAAGCFLIEGGKMVREALRCGSVRTALVDENRLAEYEDLTQALAAVGTQVLCAPAHVLAAVCETRTPQGIAAAAALPVPPAGVAGDLLVALDGVQDPGNVGTILRTADAAGFHGLLLGPGCADVYGGKALRATMGSIFRVPVRQTPDLATALADLRGQGWAVLTGELGGTDFFARGALPVRQALVIGSEGGGVSPAVSAQATHRLALPMRGGAESLNAAVAAGIMMYALAQAKEFTA
ncbi:MAG: RNA methyltransferase [Oscillospiraceae bacterium]|jgi:TrmH family RNA methyltransferase|nr:RNA methyltransferase [Oscillospiraceae bacterium]